MTLRPSLFRHLLAWALGALLLVWASFVYVGHRTGLHEADELTDGHLASVASLLLTQKVSGFAPAPDAAALGGMDGVSGLRAHDYQQSLSVVIWDRDGQVVARTGEAPTPAFAQHEGFETLTLGSPPAQWRAFSRWDGPAHQRRIVVLLSLAERDGLADDIADQVSTPGLWLLPVARKPRKRFLAPFLRRICGRLIVAGYRAAQTFKPPTCVPRPPQCRVFS